MTGPSGTRRHRQSRASRDRPARTQGASKNYSAAAGRSDLVNLSNSPSRRAMRSRSSPISLRRLSICLHRNATPATKMAGVIQTSIPAMICSSRVAPDRLSLNEPEGTGKPDLFRPKSVPGLFHPRGNRTDPLGSRVVTGLHSIGDLPAVLGSLDPPPLVGRSVNRSVTIDQRRSRPTGGPADQRPNSKDTATWKSASGPSRQHLFDAARRQHRLRPGFQLGGRSAANPLANRVRKSSEAQLQLAKNE